MSLAIMPPGDADWSDFALWWPDKAIWLNKPRQTLYAYGIMSNAQLEFVPVHRYINIEMPNRQRYQMRVNFAIMTFFTVAEICREFGVRHPEELSFMRSPFDKENFAKLTGWSKRRKVGREVGGWEGGIDFISHFRKVRLVAPDPAKELPCVTTTSL